MKQKANFSKNPVKGKPVRKRMTSLEPLEERIAPAVTAGPVSNGILAVSYGSPGDSATVTATGSGAISVVGTGISTSFTGVSELVIVFNSTNQGLTTVDSAATFGSFLTKTSVHGPIIQSIGATTGTTILDSTGGNIFDFGGVTSGMTLTSNSNADTISATKSASYTLANGLLTSSDNLSLTLAGTAGITTANLTDSGGTNTFNVSGWTHGGTMSGLSTDTVVDTKSGSFTLTANNLSDSRGLSVGLSGIAIANLTDSSTGGGHSFTVSGWGGTGTLTNNGSASDTVVASNSGGFTLSSTSVAANGGFSLTLGTNVLTANLTDTSVSAQTFNVSGWAGTGSLTSTSTLDTVLASQPAGYTLANGSLASTDGMSLTLNGITNANLTDTVGGNNFTVSGWTHGGALTGGSSTPDTITASKSGYNFTLSNGSLASNDGLNVSLSHFGTANLTDTHGGQSFTVSGWTGLGTLTDTSATLDTVVAIKTGASFTLSNTSLASSDNMSLALAGATQTTPGFGTANLTDSGGGQSFTVSGWTGGGTLTNGNASSADTVMASKAAGYSLAAGSLTSTDNMSLVLSGTFGTANLTDTAGGNSFNVTGWTGLGTLTDASYAQTADTIVAVKNVSYTLTNTSLVDTGADSMSLTLGGSGPFIANLTDTGGGHSFTVSGWTGTGTLTNDGATADTLIASKQAGYTLANNLLDSTDNMSLTLAAGAPGHLTAPFGTANLTDTTGSVSFTVSGWTGKGTLTDNSVSVTADAIVASKASGFTLANNLLQSGDGMSLTLTPATGGSNLGIGTADLTDTVGGNTFIVGGWTGSGTLTDSSSAPVVADTITASKAAGYTLSSTLLASTDNMSLTLSGDFATANLTDTQGGESFTVSQWVGSGSLINTNGTPDTIVAVKNASYVLANNLVTSTDGMSFGLTGKFGTANLTDLGGGNSFTISAWTGNGTLDNASNPVVADTLIINKTVTVTLGNTSVTSGDGMSLILAGGPGAFGSAQLKDTTGGKSYDVSGFTGALSLSNTSGSPDTIVATASSGYVLTNSSLLATDGLSLTLSGSFGTANLTDTTGGHSFTVSGWTGSGTFDNSSSPAIPDTIVATKNASFTLGNSLLLSSDTMAVTLEGAFGTAYLTDTGGNHSFTADSWTGNGSLIDNSAPLQADTISATKSASYTLSNTVLLSSDGMSLTLAGIGTANLKDNVGGQTFTVSGWTGGGTLTNSSNPVVADTIIATKSAGYGLTNTLLTSTDTMSLNLAGLTGAFGTANLTDMAGGHSFTVSGWSGNGSLTDGSSPLAPDTVVAAKTSSFVLSNQSLSSGAMSLSLSAIGVANLTDSAGGASFTVSGWTGSGTLTNGGSGAADTVVATKAAGYVLANTSLAATDNMSLNLSGSFGTANLTDTAGGNSFTVSGWTGKGTLTDSSGGPLVADTIVASKSGSYTLTNGLLISTDSMSLTLAGAAGAFGTANLTDTNGGDSFTVSGWTGNGTLTNSSIPAVADTIIASKGAGYALTNSLLTSTDNMSLTLAGAAGAFGVVKLTDTHGGNSFTVSGWTGKGTLTNSGESADTLVASKSASYTLSNTLLASTDHMSLALVGGFGTANLTDTGGGNSFTVSGWTAKGTLTNSGTPADTIVASEGASYTLSNALLTTSLGTSLTLSGAFGTANLTDASGGNTFTVSGWTGSGTLTNAEAFSAPDTIVASKAAGYVLTNLLLTSTDKMSLALAGGTGAFETAELSDTAGGNTFTVGGWTGGGALTNSGSKQDTVVASKSAGYALADSSLSSSDGMSLALASAAPGSLSHPFGTANLTDTGGNQSFSVSGWSGGGTLIGPSTDTVTASKAGGFVLSNTLLKDTADAMSLTLNGIANADLTDSSAGGGNVFAVSGWTGAAVLTNTGSAGDIISASKSASYTLTNNGLTSSDGMSLALSGFVVANLTDTGGSNSFTVTGWTNGGTLTGPASDAVVAVKNGGFTLTNTSLSDAGDTMSLGLNGIGIALLTDTAGSQSFTVGGWTGGGTLTNSGPTPDTVLASKAASYTLTNTSLASSDGMSLTLAGSGGITAAALTDTAGVQSFTVSGWTNAATLTGPSTDTVVAVKAGGFTLTNTTLIETADAMSITLSGIGGANLTDTAGNDSITLSDWTGTGTLTNDGARGDTLIAAKSASFTLSNTELRTSDGMNMALAGGTGAFETANLTDLLVVNLIKVPGGSITQDAGGGNTFTVSGWTGGGTLENDGTNPDAVAATKSASFTLTDAGLVSSDGMSLTFAGSGGINTANLTDTGGNHTFTVDGWNQGGSLTGTTGDTLSVTKNANFTLTDTSIMASDGPSVGLSMSLLDIPIAKLSVATPTYGPTTFDASGFSGTLTATGGSPIPTAAGLAPLGNVFYGGSGHNTLIGGTDQDRYILQGLSTESDTLVEPANDAFATVNGYDEIGNSIIFSHMTTPTEIVDGVKFGVNVDLNDISPAGVTQLINPSITNTNPQPGEAGTLTLIGNPGSFDQLAGSPFKDTLIGNDAARFSAPATVQILDHLLTSIYSGGDTTAEDTVITGQGGAYVIYGQHLPLTQPVPSNVFQLPTSVPYFDGGGNQNPETTVDAKHPLTYTDNFGTVVSITLRGPGEAQVYFDTVSNDPDLLALFGTTAASGLTVKVATLKGLISVGDITDGGNIGSILLGTGVSLAGEPTETAVALADVHPTGSIVVTAQNPALNVTGSIGSLTVDGLGAGAELVAGSIGSFTSTGAIGNGSSLSVAGKLGSFTVNLTKAAGDVVAVDGLSVQAASIGSVSVSLTGATGLLTDGIAVDGSTFAATNGNMGPITASVAGITGVNSPASGSGAAIVDSAFLSAGGITSITAKTAGIGYAGQSLSLIGVVSSSFAANDNIGAVHVTETAGGKGYTPVITGIQSSSTAPSRIEAGGSIASVSVTGNVSDTDIFAGANLGGSVVEPFIARPTGGGVVSTGGVKIPTTNAGLSTISLGPVTITGSLTSDAPGAIAISASGDMGDITVDGNMIGYALAAGFDGATGAADGNGRIAEVIVKGQFANSSIVAGVAPAAPSTATPYLWGAYADSAGASLEGVTQKSRIGPVILGALTAAINLQSDAQLAHDSAIEAYALTSIKIGKLATVSSFSTTPSYIDENGGAEAVIDTVVRIDV